MERPIKTVAVIGAGVSGTATAIHAKAAGLDVIVYERTNRAGGVWVYDDRTAVEPAYPSMLPSIGDTPEIPENSGPESHASGRKRRDSFVEDYELDLRHAPPGPCYAGLMNNVSTVEMEMTTTAWKEGTGEFVPHHVMADYIQDAASVVESCIQYRTRVTKVEKSEGEWLVKTSQLSFDNDKPETIETAKYFDAVVVASGHYHACKVPDILGLSVWRRRWPSRIKHSKSYRNAESFRDQNVLLIGAGVSSTDIARELGSVAKRVYQVSRGGMYDLPAAFLPDNAVRIGEISSFDLEPDTVSDVDNWAATLPGTVTLKDGRKLCDIHRVILATGYHMSYPFLRPYHADQVEPADANDTVLVTDGTQTHNLHKDIFYIPDPTLSFIGVPYHVATFSLFEFQAMALAAVYSGRAALPDEPAMRREYRARVEQKGAGRTFHSLKVVGEEIGYVRDLIDWVNTHRSPEDQLEAHTQRWHEAYKRRLKRLEERLRLIAEAQKRDHCDDALSPVVLCR